VREIISMVLVLTIICAISGIRPLRAEDLDRPADRGAGPDLCPGPGHQKRFPGNLQRSPGRAEVLRNGRTERRRLPGEARRQAGRGGHRGLRSGLRRRHRGHGRLQPGERHARGHRRDHPQGDPGPWDAHRRGEVHQKIQGTEPGDGQPDLPGRERRRRFRGDRLLGWNNSSPCRRPTPSTPGSNPKSCKPSNRKVARRWPR
jgi:hypothetical protein